MNKSAVIALGAVALLGLTVVLMVAGFAAGAVWTRARAADDGAWYGPGMMGYDADDNRRGRGTMSWGMMGYGMMGGADCAYRAPKYGDVSSLDEAAHAFEAYVDDLAYSGLGNAELEITEVMEFERNYYAIAAEQDTGIGAMELLLDKGSGLAGPEPGPNMMWNDEYGHMGGRGGMMRSYAAGEMTLSPEQAQEVAQRWLDANVPGTTAGEADPFYGYYTLHFLEDGETAGMLSVHGRSGDVWYHTWHGDFVAMMEGHD